MFIVLMSFLLPAIPQEAKAIQKLAEEALEEGDLDMSLGTCISSS